MFRMRLYSGAILKKIRQNVEVEMLGGPWVELLEDKRPIYEGAEGALEWIMAAFPFDPTFSN